ncbi:MAG: hypothetical protein LC799_21340 [Actinobacteria bacterium]|nr:hypothetical protein [Actinomycetota bacterium]
MILAIGSQNNFLHIYDDERELLADDDIGAGVGESRFPLEFFDSDGHRLAGVYDGKWHLLRLMPTADPVRPDAVQYRVWQVIARLRELIKSYPQEVALFGLTEDEALELFPLPDESHDLRTTLLSFTVAEARSSHSTLMGLGDNDTQGVGHGVQHFFGTAH